MDKKQRLQELEKELVIADLLLKKTANLVFGEGNIDCQVMFIGEAPGFTEDQLKRPFVGRSGKLLDDMLGSIKWKRSDVYITNIVKRRPPENRDPLPEEIEAYKPFLAKQIEIINPKVIATLGRFSMNYFLPLAKITRDHGKIFEVENKKIYPLFHPAAALRAAGVMDDLKADFKKLPSLLGNEVSIDAAAGTAAAKNETSSSAIKKSGKPDQAKLF
ncbi:MAG: uracil-DNA glycosylase [Patescibacteria group bacterium]